MRLSRFKKLMLEAVAFSLTPAQITILRAEFNAIDTDRSVQCCHTKITSYSHSCDVLF